MMKGDGFSPQAPATFARSPPRRAATPDHETIVKQFTASVEFLRVPRAATAGGILLISIYQ